MYRMDSVGNLVLPWGDTLLISMKIEGDIPEGTSGVFAICDRTGQTVKQKPLGIVDGVATIALTNEESEALGIGLYHWDVRLITTLGGEKTNVVSIFAPSMRTLQVTEVAVDV